MAQDYAANSKENHSSFSALPKSEVDQSLLPIHEVLPLH